MEYSLQALEARLLCSAWVAGRYFYYGDTPGYGDVQAADKTALLPNQAASFANVTSYVGGINEIAIDVADGAGSYSGADFVFRVGQSGNPAAWNLAPTPVSVTAAAGAGVNGSTRVFVRWASGSIVNEWLQVTFTPAQDTFYAGNLIGASGGLTVNAADEAVIQANYSSWLNPVGPTCAYDFNRDGKVDTFDLLLARAAAGHSLTPFAPPPSVAGRFLYYGGTPAYGDVLAADKSVLLPTQTGSFANMTSYVGGINEIVIDVAGGSSSYSGADFVFRAGPSGNPATWSLAPPPASVTTVVGAGVNGTTRIYVRWAFGSIVNEWLQVTFTPSQDTFYAGSLIGASGGLNVLASDETGIQANYSSWLHPVGPTCVYDFNRDGKVDAYDRLVARAAAGHALASLAAPASVAGRYLYYGDTPYFGDVAAVGKTALLPNQAARFANVTSYVGGINEIAIDVANGAGSYGAADFVFRIGQTGDPATWNLAPDPLSVVTEPGAGVNGSARVYVRWPSGSLIQEWLEVTFLPAQDTFFFGSLVGATSGLSVTADDEAAVQAHFSSYLNPDGPGCPYDFNRDGKVDTIDQLIAHHAIGSQLSMVEDPDPAAAPPDAPANLQATVQSPFSIGLTWTAGGSASTAYRIERFEAGSGTWSLLATAPAGTTSYTDETVEPLAQYAYLVSAVNGTWSSPASNSAEGTTPSAVTRDAAGWTQVIPSPRTQIIYVSSSAGSDANDGLTADSPVQTLAHAESLFASGNPAWLLLKAGDTWHEAVGGWKWPGLSAQEPSLIGSYGTGPRPVLKTGNEEHGFYLSGGGGAPPTLSFIDVIGLDFYANGRDPNSPDFDLNSAAHPVGFLELRPGTNILIEDCAFSYYETNIVIQGDDPVGGADRVSDVTIRRCVIVDAYALGPANSQGIFIHDADGVLIEENVLDHNGWNTLVTGADPTVFNHNMYLTDGNTGVVVRDNISADASSHGIMQRSGGLVEGNLLLNDPISISVGNTYGVPSEATQVTGNVVMDGSSIVMQYSVPLAWAIVVDPTNPSTLIQGNVIAHDICPGNNVEAVEVSGNNNTVTGNVIYNWRGGIIDLSHTAVIDPGQVNPSNLADPTRSIESYMTALGLTPSRDAFLGAAREQSRYAWNAALSPAAVVAYLQAGFVMPAPTGVSLTIVNSSTVNLSWDAVAGAAGYQIERSLKPGDGWAVLATLNAGTLSYQDRTIVGGQNYYYRLYAVNGIGLSEPSDTVSVELAAWNEAFNYADGSLWGQGVWTQGGYSDPAPQVVSNDLVLPLGSSGERSGAVADLSGYFESLNAPWTLAFSLTHNVVGDGSGNLFLHLGDPAGNPLKLEIFIDAGDGAGNQIGRIRVRDTSGNVVIESQDVLFLTGWAHAVTLQWTGTTLSLAVDGSLLGTALSPNVAIDVKTLTLSGGTDDPTDSLVMSWLHLQRTYA